MMRWIFFSCKIRIKLVFKSIHGGGIAKLISFKLECVKNIYNIKIKIIKLN
jgi:hypothetical protein